MPNFLIFYFLVFYSSVFSLVSFDASSILAICCGFSLFIISMIIPVPTNTFIVPTIPPMNGRAHRISNIVIHRKPVSHLFILILLNNVVPSRYPTNTVAISNTNV